MRTSKAVAVVCSAIALIAPLEAASATQAEDSSRPTCRGQEATMVGDGFHDVHGTSGRDVIVGNGSFVYGKRGNDLICSGNQARGRLGDDVIVRPWAFGVGGPGDDRYYGGRAYDAFQGGSGDDTMVGRKTMDWFVPGRGVDRYFGGAGRDIVGYHGEVDVRVNLQKGVARGEGKDALRSVRHFAGGRGTYVVVGTDRRNTFEVRGGVLRARGLGGNDRFLGTRANDVLRGGRGDDYLRGGRGHDRGHGGPGHDRCVGVERARGCEA